jgi:hypothetical protein
LTENFNFKRNRQDTTQTNLKIGYEANGGMDREKERISDNFYCVGNVPHNEKWGVCAGERGRKGMRVWGGKGAGLGNDVLSFRY